MMLLSTQTLLALLSLSTIAVDAFRVSNGPVHKREASQIEGRSASLGRLKEELVADKAKVATVKRQLARAKKDRLYKKAEAFAKREGELEEDSEALESKIELARRARTALTAQSMRTPIVAQTPSTTSTTTAPTTTSTTSKAGRVPLTATTSSSTTPSPSTVAKKGLGYNTASFTWAFGKGLGWAYNWANAPGGTLLATTEFVPMLWGSDATGWAANAQAAINSGSTHLLGFNEPDLSTQSNILPAAAAALWKANMEPFYGKAKLVSPAITNGGAPGGVTWMAEFLGNCTTCHIDAIAAHWYDAAWNTGYFTNYFTDMAATFGKPIWITEFAGSGTVAAQQTFLEYVIPWMESNTFIERYAGFGDFAGTYVDSTGALTALGTTYADTL